MSANRCQPDISKTVIGQTCFSHLGGTSQKCTNQVSVSQLSAIPAPVSVNSELLSQLSVSVTRVALAFMLKKL
jgi:hypothetical protein